MSGYEQRNRQVIQRSLSRLQASEEATILDGMMKVVEAGLEFLVEIHEDYSPHMSHLHETDTLGYALAHEGIIVKSGMHSGGDYLDLPGRAMEEAQDLLSTTHGWAAIILSEMRGWYSVNLEITFLSYSADMVKQNFRRYFKPVRR